MVLLKSFGYLLCILLQEAYVAFGRKTFVTSFQTNIKDNTLATADVWIEFSSQIPRAREFTVCHWIKIKFYNSDIAACLWSYCTVEKLGHKMECLQVCMKSAYHTMNRNLSFERGIKLRHQDKVDYKNIELKYYHHRTWTHLCWSYSSLTGNSKYYHDGVVFGVERFNVSNGNVALRASSEMNDYALIFGQDPDRMRGGFEKEQAFLGHLSELNIWNLTLSDLDILEMASCKTQMKGNIVAWDISILIRHNVVVKDVKDIHIFAAIVENMSYFLKK